MATRYLTGTYNAGYTLSAAYTAVQVDIAASIGGTGLVGNANPDTVVNLGRIAATSAGATGVSLQSGGTVSNGDTSHYMALIAGGAGGVGSAGGMTGGTGGSGGVGISIAGGGTIVTLGTVDGGAGGSGGSGTNQGGAGGAGGIGINLDGGGSINNDGIVSGGAGGSGGLAVTASSVDVGAGGNGGAAVAISGGGTVVNSFTITGGSGGFGSHGGAGGAGIVLANGGSVINEATIAGGAAGEARSSYAGTGGDGVKLLASGYVLNEATISGGSGGAGAGGRYGGVGGDGGNGLELLGGGIVVNSATIAGGAGGYGGESGHFSGGGGAGGAGIVLSVDGTITNTGLIVGGAGGSQGAGNANGGGQGPGGAGVVLSNGGYLRNTGQIQGGPGGFGYGPGIVFDAGTATIDNLGAVVGGIYSSSGTTLSITNGSAGDSAALISGGIDARGIATITNYGQISAASGGVAVSVNSQSLLVLEGGGTLFGKVAGGGGALEFAAAGGAGSFSGLGSHYSGFARYTVLYGGDWTLSGVNTVSSGTTLTNSGTLIETGQLAVRPDGVITGVTVASGGYQQIYGTAVDTVVNAGGSQIVESAGGIARGTVLKGGAQYVFGSATSTSIYNGGLLLVEGQIVSRGVTTQSNGIVRSTAVYSGGTEDVRGVDIGAVVSGGRLLVESGGVASNATIATNGMLELAASGGLGGAVMFTGSGGELRIDGMTIPTNTLSGFAAGDRVDLAGIAFDSAGSVSLSSGNVLQVHENGTIYSLQLDPNQSYSGDTFSIRPDTGTGTLVVARVASPLTFALANFATNAGGWTSQDCLSSRRRRCDRRRPLRHRRLRLGRRLCVDGDRRRQVQQPDSRLGQFRHQ